MHGARASAESFSGARGWLIISPNSSGCPKARRHSIKKVYQVGYVKYCSLLNKAHEVIKNNLILAFFALKLTRISICAQKKYAPKRCSSTKCFAKTIRPRTTLDISYKPPTKTVCKTLCETQCAIAKRAPTPFPNDLVPATPCSYVLVTTYMTTTWCRQQPCPLACAG
jgi:hypothetical protein